MSDRVKAWRVTHPECGEIVVIADSAAIATTEAAQWGVSWPKTAAMMDAVYIGMRLYCTCSRCKRQFVTEVKTARCPACQKTHEYEIKKYAQRIPYVDRRAGAKN